MKDLFIQKNICVIKKIRIKKNVTQLLLSHYIIYNIHQYLFIRVGTVFSIDGAENFRSILFVRYVNSLRLDLFIIYLSIYLFVRCVQL